MGEDDWSLAALQVADVATTAYILGALGGEEQNPLARLLTDLGWPGLALLLIVKLWPRAGPTTASRPASASP